MTNIFLIVLSLHKAYQQQIPGNYVLFGFVNTVVLNSLIQSFWA